jgi:N-acetylglutamate synthase-like GNAT family acetyltransferase
MTCLQAIIAADSIEQAFERDNEFYRTKKFFNRRDNNSKEPLSWVYIDELKGQQLTFLSRVFTKGEVSDIDLSDEDCHSLKSSYKILGSPCTPIENIQKIKRNEKDMADWKRMNLFSEEYMNHIISCKKQNGLWGPIIDEESKRQAGENISRIVSQTVNNFLLRHTITISEYMLYGLVVLYPGHNTKILENECCGNQTSPVWAVGDLQYKIVLSAENLKIDLITVNKDWQRNGHAYAMVRYITDFAKEHFSFVSRLSTSCRHEVSAKIFEKVGFIKVQSKAKSELDDTTHSRPNNDSCDGWRGQRVVGEFHESGARYYGPWFNENHSKIMTNEYHKVGYKYFYG